MNLKLILYALTFFKTVFTEITDDEITVRQSCGIANPKSEMDCYLKTGKDTYCCYMKATSGTSSQNLCYALSYSQYTTQFNTNYQGLQYSVTCASGLTSDQRLPNCGIDSPKDLSNCTAASTEINSCCFSSGTQNKCYSLGMKYKGVTIWQGFQLSCTSNFLQMFSLINMFLLFIFMN
jgi:hypothetical protein